MKVTNKTAYATIGCDVQLSENDRLALGIELDKFINWLNCYKAKESETESIKAMDKIIAFVSKCAIRPSQSNVFTDSPEDFEKADEATTAVEPVPMDDVITVDISNTEPENLMKLTKIIFNVTDSSLVRIKNTFNSAKEKHISCISFRCINRRKENVIDEVVSAGCQIVPNGVNSLRL